MTENTGKPKGQPKGGPKPSASPAQSAQQDSVDSTSTPSAAAAPQKPNVEKDRPSVPCYAFSRGQCTVKERDCPQKRAHRMLTKEERDKRDEYESRMLAAGRSLGYVVDPPTPAVPATKSTPRSTKPKAAAAAAVAVEQPNVRLCRQFSHTGYCLLGGAPDCPLRHERQP